jgi:hypothetical protein
LKNIIWPFLSLTHFHDRRIENGNGECVKETTNWPNSRKQPKVLGAHVQYIYTIYIYIKTFYKVWKPWIKNCKRSWLHKIGTLISMPAPPPPPRRWRRSAKYNQCHCCIRTFRSCINCYNWSTGIRRLIILYFEKWLGYNDVIYIQCIYIYKLSTKFESPGLKTVRGVDYTK